MLSPNSGAKFRASVVFEDDDVVVAVRGDLDGVAAAHLSSLLATLVDQDHHHLIVDCAALDFVDIAGLRAITAASKRLQPLGSVTLRSLPDFARRVVDLSGACELIPVEGPAVRPSGSLVVLPVEGREHLVVAMLGRVTEVMDAALSLVVALARATVDGVDGAAVTLRRHGQLTTVASTDALVSSMDRCQYVAGEGPCVAATAEGERFHLASASEETRWPQFVPEAMAAGIASVLSTPLLVLDGPVGALNLYSRTERVFGSAEQDRAGLLAENAATILRSAGVSKAAEPTGLRLFEALRSRETIAQSQGVLMERHGLSANQASGTLRRGARRRELSVLQQAADLLESTAPRGVGPGSGRELDG